jgi:alkylation response protein AidB-like acyl-CoA dehydrogenase
MNLSLSDEQLQLRESARRYLAERYTFAQWRATVEAGGIDLTRWADFADFGWLGLSLPAKAGGLDGTMTDVMVLTEEFGRALVVEPYVSAVILCGTLLQSAIDSPACAALLMQIGQGRARLALAYEDDPGTPVTSRSSGDRWDLSGAKKGVSGAATTHYLVTSGIGKTSERGLWLVAADEAGVSCEGYQTPAGSLASDIRFDRVPLPRTALLMRGDMLEAALERARDHAALAVCAESVGAMAAVIGATVEYLRGRMQFGNPLASLQVLRHRVAEMALRLEEARAITLFAAASASGEEWRRMRAVSAAKVKVGAAARWVCEQAVQLHGAMGMTEELEVGAYLKTVITLDRLWGTRAGHLRRYRVLAGRHGFATEPLMHGGCAATWQRAS